MLFFRCFSHNYDRYLDSKNDFFALQNNNNNKGVDFNKNLYDSIQIIKKNVRIATKNVHRFSGTN
jgi:hypothetical protein